MNFTIDDEVEFIDYMASRSNHFRKMTKRPAFDAKILRTKRKLYDAVDQYLQFNHNKIIPGSKNLRFVIGGEVCVNWMGCLYPNMLSSNVEAEQVATTFCQDHKIETYEFKYFLLGIKEVTLTTFYESNSIEYRWYNLGRSLSAYMQLCNKRL